MAVRTVTPGNAPATAAAAAGLFLIHALGLLTAAPLSGAQQQSLPGVPDSVLAPMDSIEGLLAAEPGRPDAPELLYRLGRLKSDHLPRINIALIDIPGDSVRFATEAKHAALEAYVGEHQAEYDPLGIPAGGYEYNGWHFGELVRRFPHHALAEEAAYRFAIAGPGHEAQLLRRTTRFLRERSGSGYAPRVIAAVNELLERMASAYLEDPWWDTRGFGGYHYTFEPVQPLIPEYDDVVRTLPARVRRPALPTLVVLWTALGCGERAVAVEALVERELTDPERAFALERIRDAQERAGDRSCLLDLGAGGALDRATAPPFEQTGVSGVRRVTDNSACPLGLSIVNTSFGVDGEGRIIRESYEIICPIGEMLIDMRAWTHDGLAGEPLWTISPAWPSRRPENWPPGGGRIYRIPATLCCGNVDYGADAFYSIATGARLFVATESGEAGRMREDAVLRIFASAGRQTTGSRFVAYHGSDAGGDAGLAPPETERDGVIGVLQYGDDRHPAARYALHAPGYHVAALRLRATSGGLDDDARELRLEAAADAGESAAFDGFSVVVELLPPVSTIRGRPGPVPDGPVELVIPVEADRLVVERARAPEGVRLEASPEEKRRRAP